MRYVSSAYLQSAFPLVTACKSDASTTSVVSLLWICYVTNTYSGFLDDVNVSYVTIMSTTVDSRHGKCCKKQRLDL